MYSNFSQLLEYFIWYRTKNKSKRSIKIKAKYVIITLTSKRNKKYYDKQ